MAEAMSDDGPQFVFAPVHATVVRDKGDEVVADAITPACDFCLDTRVRWEYVCPDFEIPQIRFGSHGNWLACERCAEMIQTGDYDGLAARSIHSWVQRHGPIDRYNRDNIIQIQHGFIHHRSGPRFQA